MKSGEPSVHDEISLDRTYRVLANARRRYVLEFLERHQEVSLADLAEFIACREKEKPLDEIEEDEVLHVYTSLWHRHIPKLVDAGFIDYEQDEDVVRPHMEAPDIPEYNDLDQRPGPWDENPKFSHAPPRF